MKIGLKVYPDNIKLIEKHFDIIDFVEIMAIEGSNFESLYDIGKENDVMVHSEGFDFGVNYADPGKLETNDRSLKYAKTISKNSKAKHIVVHPGKLENLNCSNENFLEYFEKPNNFYSKILIENLPYDYHGIKCLGRLPQDIDILTRETGFGFCLDLENAWDVAYKFKINLYVLIEEFLKLDPVLFHFPYHFLPGKQEEYDYDDVDLTKLLSLLPKDAKITLEVPKDKVPFEYVQMLKAELRKIK